MSDGSARRVYQVFASCWSWEVKRNAGGSRFWRLALNAMVQGLVFVLILPSCNAEILNFGVEDDVSSLEPAQFPIELSAGANEIESVIFLNETVKGRDTGVLWLSLDTGGSWDAYVRFTLRISWAANFSISLYNPPDASLERVKYAHIHAVHSGVFTPPVERTSEPPRVPFTVLLDPWFSPVLVCLGVVYAVLAKMAMEARKESVVKAMKRK
ncbi:hypothetical protein CPB85DRAFT_1282855 [Mucidula mucida]|nr:hypothetical protein CPB85DRAFT_1282855 [Mucidula mucida]